MPLERFRGIVDLLCLHAANPERYPYLLETFGTQGWDILFAFPKDEWRYELSEVPRGNFFSVFDRAWRDRPSINKEGDVPFRGGWFIYLGYELLHELEATVGLPKDASDSFPLAIMTRIPAAIMCDKVRGETYLFSEDARYLAHLKADIEQRQPFASTCFTISNLIEEDEAIYLQGIDQVKNYIRQGDVFQVNLSREWQAEIHASRPALDLYASLRRNNPAAFGGLAQFGKHAIISSSPERLVKVTDALIETRPIAGTYPRSTQPAEDERLRHELISNPKERAEHIMLVDLERNDLGRVAEPGTVKVNELMQVKTYAHVHHIESIVQAIKKANITPPQILRAVFPGGTITGCPKVRTMQIINELEVNPRFAYTGSMGYLNLDGDMDFNILIRSFMLTSHTLKFRAGGGIVADSDPQRELAETRAKAKGLLKSLA